MRVWPVVLLAAGLLVWRGQARAAFGWMGLMFVACVLVAASKIAFYGWGIGVREWDLTCFSGHTVQALGLWPLLLAIAVPVRWPGWRMLAFWLGVLLAGLVGIARIVSHAHSPAEVLAGALLGLPVALLGRHLLRGASLPPRRSVLVFAVAALLFVVDDGRFLPRLPSERWLQQTATYLSGRAKPYSRNTWARQMRETKPEPPAAMVAGAH